MSARFRVSGVLAEDQATYTLVDADSGAPGGTVLIAELCATIRMTDAQGNELAPQTVALTGTDALAFQKALRRFLAEINPGVDFDFEEVPEDSASLGSALMLGADEDWDDEEDEDE